MCVEMWTTEFYTTYGILYELPHQDVPKIFHISVGWKLGSAMQNR